MADKLLMLMDCAVAETAFIEDNAMEFVRWLKEEKQEMDSSWLVVFDAYDQGTGGSDFFEVYPRRWSVSVLVTSRDLQLDIGQGVAVGKLRLDDAITLLAKRALIDLEYFDYSNSRDEIKVISWVVSLRGMYCSE
jgi:hypothetical protein